MTADQHITDPLLLSVLNSAAQARQQSLAILDLIDTFHTSARNETTQDPSIPPPPPSPSPSPTQQQQLELSQHHKTLTTHLTHLRHLHHNALHTTRATKTATTTLRQEIDTLHLTLQNLHYEQNHLRGEIAACAHHDHPHTSLPLIPLPHFLEQHPEYEGKGEDEVTVARIEDEYRRRVELEEERVGLVRRKEGLVREVGGKREELGRLDAEVEKWVQGLEGVRKVFEDREKKSTEGGGG